MAKLILFNTTSSMQRHGIIYGVFWRYNNIKNKKTFFCEMRYMYTVTFAHTLNNTRHKNTTTPHPRPLSIIQHSGAQQLTQSTLHARLLYYTCASLRNPKNVAMDASLSALKSALQALDALDESIQPKANPAVVGQKL
jgi:hypothetical protein